MLLSIYTFLFDGVHHFAGKFGISNQKLYIQSVFYIIIMLQQLESWVTGYDIIIRGNVLRNQTESMG